MLPLWGDSREAGHEVGVPWESSGRRAAPSGGLALSAVPQEETGVAGRLQPDVQAAAAGAPSPRGVYTYALSGSKVCAGLVERRKAALLGTKLRSRKNAASSEAFRQPCVPCTKVCPPLWWISK